jgi:hypothetical protein
MRRARHSVACSAVRPVMKYLLRPMLKYSITSTADEVTFGPMTAM